MRLIQGKPGPGADKLLLRAGREPRDRPEKKRLPWFITALFGSFYTGQICFQIIVK